jgi:hypothetical protein
MNPIARISLLTAALITIGAGGPDAATRFRSMMLPNVGNH